MPLSSSLWEAANILRGSAVDRTDWKGYILPLLFFKRISDVWDEEHARMLEQYGEDFEDEHRFQIPDGCHWDDIRSTPQNVGAALKHAMQEIERVNPDTLTRVFGTGDWGNKEKFTDELIHDNVGIGAVHDDLETLVVDAELLEAVLGSPDPDKKSMEVEIKVAQRLRKHRHDPRFKALAERLEELKKRHEQGLLVSVDFLKELLELAKDVVATEHASPPIEQEERGKTALTELFENARSDATPIIVEHVVTDIDAIVRQVRFDGWQNTHAGEREIKKALRKRLFKYQLHSDTELFDRAYGYICEYY